MSELCSKTNKIELLTELNEARQHGNWYWSIIELKNYSLIESFDLNTRSPDIISFLKNVLTMLRY
jgi:hypothetical protein